jgi:hypothetical protein
MGAWGTGLFQDDTACDIRDDYKGHLGNGLSGPEATARILIEFKSLLDDPAESSVVWFSLSAVQWRHGRLEPETRERALELIDSGADLTRWHPGSRDFAKRRAVLEKLRVQITSPQPVAKKVRKPILESCDWPVGTVISYRLISGNLAILRVIGYHTDKGGTSPICELLDWTGTEVPSQETLRSAKVREGGSGHSPRIHRFMIFRLDKNAAKRIARLDFTLEPFHKPVCPVTATHWKEFDDFLKRWFQME